MTNTTNTPANVQISAELASRIADALGRFVSDEGWGQADMDTSDDLAAVLAAPVVQEPVATIDVQRHGLAGPSAVCLALDAALDLTEGRHEVYAVPVGAVPSKWQLVPIKPTRAMLRASVAASEEPGSDYDTIYRAMLAAAPTPPAAVQQEAPSDDEIQSLWTEHKSAPGAMGFARALLARYGVQPAASVEPVANCYSSNDGDTWRDCPDDADFLDGLKLGDEYELQASIRSWPERFRVTKVPDDVSDEYEVEPISIRTAAPVAAQPKPASWAAELDAIRADLMADIREVFDASGPETQQSVRDVIEYVDSWLSVFAQKQSLAPSAPAQPQPSGSAAPQPEVSVAEAERVAGLPAVDAALSEFCDDATADNAVALVRIIMDTALAAQPSGQAQAGTTMPPMTPELESILGTICYQCIPFAQALRAAGREIDTRAESEQAAVIHWMLGHYMQHGENWRDHASTEMEAWRDAARKGEGGAA